MSFTSHIFVFYFLPVVLIGYYLVPRGSHLLRTLFLLVASYAFYAWLAPWFVLFVFCTTAFNYVLCRFMAGCSVKRGKRFMMAASLAVNLALLGFFKYAMFFQNSANDVLKLYGTDTLPVLQIVLPAGISFYTFKILSYTIDVYRGVPPAASFLDFACYVAFFAQLLSGPIQRYATTDAKSEPVPTFAAQLMAPTHNLSKFSYGAALFILGFAKKVLLANVVGEVADAVFAAEAPPALDAWFGVAAYSFQLYLDFSAYSEMAIGLGVMLGLECHGNFNAPYLANGITDFWRRWHISLSSWFRDYLYIPLGGNRKGVARSYFNLVVVFMLCGLWHGANWTFIVWGIYHGVLLIFERLLGRKVLYSFLPRPVQICATFVLVTVGWVFFRSPTMAAAWRLLAAMFVASPAQGGSLLLGALVYTPAHLVTMAISSVLVFQPVQAFDWAKTITWPKAAILAALFWLSLMTVFSQTFASFLYFQF